MTDDLFLAILAMDSYNRTGPALTPRGLVLPANARIGTAVLDRGGEESSTGFFAQSYSWNVHKVIAFRGTDIGSGAEFLKDAFLAFRPASGIIRPVKTLTQQNSTKRI